MKRKIKKMVKSVLCTCVSMCTPFLRKQSMLNPHTARDILDRYQPKPAGTADGCNTLLDPTCDLQIVVPAYNVEKYLAACMDSILNQQTKYTYKVVLVDDGATDKTPQIADRYADDERVMVIHQENRGLSGARNQALNRLTGKYIMFVDSDDVLCPGAIDALMNTAYALDCDIVGGGAYALKGTSQDIYFRYPEAKSVNCARPVLNGEAWAKVFKAEIFSTLIFPEGYWFEDSILSFLIYPQNLVAHVIPDMVYAYRSNRMGSITASYKSKPKSLDSYWVTEMLLAQRSHRGMVNNRLFFDKIMRQLVLNTKRMFGLPGNVQESAFVLSAELVEKYFSKDILTVATHDPLVTALLNRRWQAFKLICKVK